MTTTTTDLVSVRVTRELFRFRSEQDWVNNAKRRYANCGVKPGFYLAVDSAGHVIHMGRCFMAAQRRGLYPVTVYELQTNWAEPEGPAERQGGTNG